MAYHSAQTTYRTASARKNGAFGYKAVINYADGRSHVPVRKNFKTRDEAIEYAKKWIDANENRPIVKKW